jgi:hypothetical protein
MAGTCKCQRPEPQEVYSLGNVLLGYTCKACFKLISPHEKTCEFCGDKNLVWDRQHRVTCDRCHDRLVCPKKKRCDGCLKYVDLRCIICGGEFETNRPQGRKLCSKLECFAEQSKRRRKASAKEAKAKKKRRKKT